MILIRWITTYDLLDAFNVCKHDLINHSVGSITRCVSRRCSITKGNWILIHWFGKSVAYLDNFISVQFDRVRGQTILGGLSGPEHNTGTALRSSHTILSFYCLLLQSPITSMAPEKLGWELVLLQFFFERFLDFSGWYFISGIPFLTIFVVA